MIQNNENLLILVSDFDLPSNYSKKTVYGGA